MRVKKEAWFKEHWIQEVKYLLANGYFYVKMYLTHRGVYVIDFQIQGCGKVFDCENYEDAKAKFIAAIKYESITKVTKNTKTIEEVLN